MIPHFEMIAGHVILMNTWKVIPVLAVMAPVPQAVYVALIVAYDMILNVQIVVIIVNRPRAIPVVPVLLKLGIIPANVKMVMSEKMEPQLENFNALVA